MVDLTEISAVVAAAGVLVGVAYYILDMRNQGKMRQMDFIMRIPSLYLSKEIIQIFAAIRKTEFKNFDDFEEKCGVEARQVADFCETLGLFVKRKIVDISLVADRFDVSSRYEKLRPWLVERRKRDNNPRLYEWFEYLANEEKKYHQQQASKTA